MDDWVSAFAIDAENRLNADAVSGTRLPPASISCAGTEHSRSFVAHFTYADTSENAQK